MKNGFTLVELMIVIAIIGILAAVALPAYQDYTFRAQIVEAITITNAAKPKVQEYYQARGDFPESNAESGLPNAEFLIGNYVKGVVVEKGAIHVTLGNKIHAQLQDKVLTLRPQYVKESPITPISWLCGNASVVEGMTAAGENKTTIDPNFLPVACR